MQQLPTYHLQGIVKAREDNMEDFSGPLDLILALLSKNKIEIRDIKISLILEQYLEYLDEMKRMDLEIASEFVVMASHLMQLKTKMLLAAGDEETLDELEELMKSLEQRKRLEIYALVKEQAQLMAQRGETGRSLFVKQPEPLKRNREYRYEHSREDLTRAMEEITQRSRNALPPPLSEFTQVIEEQPFPVNTKAFQVIRRLVALGKIRLRALFQGSRSRSELVATFLALLELCKMGSIRIEGSDQQEQDSVVNYVGQGNESFSFEMDN